MEPAVLRHRDARRQATMYGAFAIVVLGVVVAAFAVPLPGRWWMLALIPVAAFLGYSAVRLATLRVRLDDHGVWEPNPFALTYLTPWDDIAQVRAVRSPGAMRLTFVSVEILHSDGDRHEVVALKAQAGSAYVEEAVDDWVRRIRAAKKAARA